MKLFQKSLSLFVIFSVFVSSSFFTVAKEQPPVGSEPKPFQVPKKHTVQLANGLKVTLIPYGNTPKATIRLITDTGNIDDGDYPWLSDISFDLLRQGTQTFSAKEIAESVASMGGQINSSVAMGASWLGADVLSEYTGDVISLLADMVLKPALAEADFKRIKKGYFRQLKVQLSQSGNLANQAFYQAIYGNHPYGTLYPTEQSLSEISLEKSSQFLVKNLVPNRSHLYISGVFDQAEVLASVQQAFADWQKGQEKQVNGVLTQTGPKVIMLERENSPQSTIRLGLATVALDHQDAMEIAMMNTLLGGAFSSRITTNIREEKGFTYSPRSQVVNRINSGIWYQSADITIESTGAALAEVFKEIALLAKEPPTLEELEGIKSYMAGIFVLRNSYRTAIINQLSLLELHGLEEQYLKDYIAKLYDVTPTQISEMVKKYLTPEKMILVTVGDKAQLEPQLKALMPLKRYW